MTFGKSRYHRCVFGSFELIRYCSIGNVIGGAGKLLKRFEVDHKPVHLVSYASRTWSANGDLYRKLGFIDTTNSDDNVGYFYVKNGTKYHRSTFTKQRLVELGNNPIKTEEVIMRENDFLKIYDCGNYRFEKKYS